MIDEQFNARDLAVEALRDRAGNVTAHLDRLLGSSMLPAVERALARELALGVVRRRETLRAVLRAFLSQPERKLPAPLEEVFFVAIYQMVFLDRVPDFAAVNEAVEQASRFRHRRQSGLVNGVLRAVARGFAKAVDGVPPLCVDVVPVGPASCRKADRPLFADPAAQPAEYLAAAFSLPPRLAERWIEARGSLEAAVALAAHANTRAANALRVNRLRADVPAVLDSLKAAGVQARAHENGVSVVLDENTHVGDLGVFRDGWVQAQDPTASAVAAAAGPEPGMNVLDLCAAPGTKTTHLAELMGNRGSITAVDVSREKLQLIEDNCRRLGIDIVQTRLTTEVDQLQPASFDLALADVPCSNTGVLARRAEARWRFDELRLPNLVQKQCALAETAARFVRPGGRLVYSTCSLEPEECSRVTRELLRRVPGLSPTEERFVLPGGAEDPAHWHDGGYFAVFDVR